MTQKLIISNGNEINISFNENENNGRNGNDNTNESNRTYMHNNGNIVDNLFDYNNQDEM